MNSCSRQGPRRAARPVTLAPTASAALIAIGLLASGAAAFAQSEPAPADKDAKKDLQTLDRVEVTSGKRRQMQSDVAGTVTAISGADIESHGSADIEDLLKLTPGVQYNKGTADGSLISIRGVGTNSNGAAQGFTQSPTGIYIEDVPFTDPFAFVSTPDLAPFDLERVEVLRGPQGALYGSSSLGGAIRYILKKPSTSLTEGSVMAGISSTADGGTGWSTAAMVNIPIAMSTGKAGLRLVLNSRKDAGFIDNLGTGVKDANVIRVDGGRLLFTYALGDDFDATATYLRQHSKQADGPGISPFDYTTGTGYTKNPDQLKLQVRTAVPMAYDSTFDLATVQANLKLGDFRLTSLTGRQTKSRGAREDFSRDFYDPSAPGDKWTSDTFYDSTSTSQEFRLAPVTPGRVNWLVGAFWMSADVKRDQLVYHEPRAAVADLRFRRNGTATEKAAFADAEIKITDRLSADIGARYYKTQLSYDRIVGNTDADATSTPYASGDSGTTPKVSLRYVIDPSMSVYALASRGYRFGGISNLGSSPQGLPYKSDSLWNYEAGWRWSPSKTASLDVSVFRIDWKDVQLSELYVDPVTTRSFLVTGNVGKARSQGLELAAAWRPFSQFSLKGTFAYTDAVTSGGISIGGTGIPDGTRLPGTAKVQGTLDASTNFEGPWDSSARVSALLAYTGQRKAQIDSDLSLPAYTTLDLRATFSWNSVEFSAFVNNLSNSRGLSSAVDYFTTYTEFYPIRPRSIGVSLRYDY
ncbi:TonB-dependent receptor [Pelomonas sp. KK5]|uniref:TonB-dependent receptor n=1 Tax=Pelomonas sp. KK5 TaxID=1855730 RepID=UPI001301EF6D|nr:TonB-dependent receptor [Pelomonas sp. KK5]